MLQMDGTIKQCGHKLQTTQSYAYFACLQVLITASSVMVHADSHLHNDLRVGACHKSSN